MANRINIWRLDDREKSDYYLAGGYWLIPHESPTVELEKNYILARSTVPGGLFIYGWTDREDDTSIVRSIGKESVIDFSVPEPHRDIIVSMVATPLTDDKIWSQAADVYYNGKKIGSKKISKKSFA